MNALSTETSVVVKSLNLESNLEYPVFRSKLESKVMEVCDINSQASEVASQHFDQCLVKLASSDVTYVS